MIKFLANLFRQLHIVIGITAPPPERDARAETRLRVYLDRDDYPRRRRICGAILRNLEVLSFLAQGIRSRSPSAFRGEAPLFVHLVHCCLHAQPEFSV